MKRLKILNSKEKKRIIETIKEQYGIKELKLDHVFLMNNDNKIFLLSNDFGKIDTKGLGINSLGLYFAKIHVDGIRLSIEGSQLIGDKAKKNILEINKNDMESWIRGKDIVSKDIFTSYIIIKYKNDFLGCGKYKDNKILNFIPKARRIIKV
tara:strand:- start:5436 stop:5891 length:456 start_codon:yes stop_codon:yes gene_type:complete